MHALARAALVLSLTALTAPPLAGCSGEATESSHASADGVSGRYDAMVGKWRFVFDGPRRKALEAEIDARASDTEERTREKAALEREAAREWIEFTADRHYVVATGSEVHARMPFTIEAGDGSRVVMRGSIRARDGSVREVAVPVEIDAEGKLVIHDPEKGPLRFERTPHPPR